MTEAAVNQSVTSSRARVAVAVLAFCCVCWGYSFPVMKVAVAAFERNLPSSAPASLSRELAVNATFIGWRFGLAAILYWLLTHRQQRGYSRSDLHGGVVVGLAFTAGMVFQIAGLRYALPSVSGFLTALAVVYAPLAQSFLIKRRVGLMTWMAIIVAIAGIAILSLPQPGAVASLPPPVPPVAFFGEALTIFGALLFTGQILALDHYGQTANTTRITFVMFVASGVSATVIGAVAGGPAIYNGEFLRAVVCDPTFQWSLLTLIVLSSVVAMHLMNGYQPLMSPAMACVVYCLEPVFATLFSVLFKTEKLTGTTMLGGMVILVAVLLVARQKRVHD
jgi:drug/metabolite transporter (DMT)-like permease